MSVTTRWEKERSLWLLERSRPGGELRRRAELLGRRARRLSRGGSGVSQTSVREDVTPPLISRMLKTDQGHKDQLARLVLVPAMLVLVGLIIGPALLVAAVIYRVLWQNSPQTGPLQAWRWLTAGGVLCALGIIWQVLLGHGLGIEWHPPLAWVVYLRVAGPIWLWAQLSLGLVLTGVQIICSGWSGVKAQVAPKPTRDKNGAFVATPEERKVRLDHHASAESPKAEQGYQRRAKLAAFTAESMTPMSNDQAQDQETPVAEEPPEIDEMTDYGPETELEENYAR